MTPEGSTVMQAVDGTTLRAQTRAQQPTPPPLPRPPPPPTPPVEEQPIVDPMVAAKPKRRPLRPETVLVLLVLANAGAILLAACLAMAVD